MVVNKFRPETRDIDGVLEIMQEIERAGRIKFTGLINNANLGKETTIEDILEGYNFCKEIEKITGLPVKFTSAKGEFIEKLKNIGNVLPVEEIKYGNWL